MFASDLELEVSLKDIPSSDEREPLIVDWDELEQSRWRERPLFELGSTELLLGS